MPNSTDLVAMRSARSCIIFSSISSARSDSVVRIDVLVHGFSFLSRPGLGDGFDCVDNSLITGAAAVVARYMIANFLPAGHAAAADQVVRADQHAGRAETALQCVASPECILQVGDGAGIGQPLDGLDLRAVALHREHQAAAHNRAVNAHRAGAANAVLAADVAAREAKVVAQEIDQRFASLDALIHVLAIDAQRDVAKALAHGESFSIGAFSGKVAPVFQRKCDQDL